MSPTRRSTNQANLTATHVAAGSPNGGQEGSLNATNVGMIDSKAAGAPNGTPNVSRKEVGSPNRGPAASHSARKVSKVDRKIPGTPDCTPVGTPDNTADQAFVERYRAISSRDARFDGQFFTAVKSTGIYCRPSCPARTPKPENVSFYLTSAAAHEAGFRACKRCLPEATPGTPEWDLRQDIAGRTMRLIADGVVDREGVDGLAQRLGFSARHVNRMLLAELGAGPVALARARRAQTARNLIVHTTLKLSDIAYASGFGSIRQFNETVSTVFDLSPTELRTRALHSARGGNSGGAGRSGGASGNDVGIGDATGNSVSAGGAGGAGRSDGASSLETGTGTETGAGSAITNGPTGVLAAVNTTYLGPPKTRVTLSLPVRTPYNAAGINEFLAARAITGVEVSDTTDPLHLRYARTVLLPGGPAAFEVTTHATDAAAAQRGEWQVSAQLELASLTDLSVAVSRIRRLFDLDADSVAIDESLGQDPHLASLVRSRPGTRLPGSVDPHELVVRAIVGQQISVVAARGHLTRLIEHAGQPYDSGFLGLTRLFPTATEILASVLPIGASDSLDSQRVLRLPRRQVNAVIAAALALRDGSLSAHVGADPMELSAQLEALPGVGPWTAAYIAMRVLGHTDSWLIGDVALIAGAKSLGILSTESPAESPTESTTGNSKSEHIAAGTTKGTPAGSTTNPNTSPATSTPADSITSTPTTRALHKRLAEIASEWSPWRSYAAMHLWHAATLAQSSELAQSSAPAQPPTPPQSPSHR